MVLKNIKFIVVIVSIFSFIYFFFALYDRRDKRVHWFSSQLLKIAPKNQNKMTMQCVFVLCCEVNINFMPLFCNYCSGVLMFLDIIPLDRHSIWAKTFMAIIEQNFVFL